MSFIRTQGPNEADGETAAMYRRQQAAWGFLPNYAKVFCHRPEVMARWGQLLAEIKRPMDERRFELVTFAAAHELRCTACAVAHGRKLRAFFDDGEIVAIANQQPATRLTNAERAMTDFARRVARDAAGITQDHVDELMRCGFTEADVFDIVATAAARAFFTKVLDGLGVQADAVFAALPVDLREALIVGRPIDTEPVAQMPLVPMDDAA